MGFPTSSPRPDNLDAVDIFCGGGGLTVGLKRAGFSVVGAVEVEPHARSTYKANHPEVHVYKDDVRCIGGPDLLGLSKSRRIDLVAGCPPCQGFSSLTAKYRRQDARNELVLEMGRLVEEVRPRAVMMENVAGLATKGRALLDAFIERLEGLGYIISKDVLQVADYGVPQTRRRFVLMAGLGFRVPIPPATHSRRGQRGLPLWRTVGDTIAGLPEPIVLSEAQAKGGAESFNWHVIRTMSPANRLRLRHTVPGKVRTCLPNKLRPDCHKGKDEGFTNVYGRLSWDSPSVTITGGCTTLSKGRFGHPEAERTISVREAALLQTFPKDYAISTPYMEKACDIVGNALPCVFAEILASAVCKALRMSKWPPPAEEEPTSFGKLSRSQLMARVGSVGNRTTEARLVSLLEAVKLEGWKLHDPLPGKPDFSWPELKVAVFVDGCFWHGHDCRNLTPRANAERWRAKILNNRRRDRQVVSELRAAGWSVIRIWECQLKREPAFCITRIKRVLTRRGGNRPLAAAAAKTAKEAKLSVRRRLEAVK